MTTVCVNIARGLEKQGVTQGSLWRKGNLLFRNNKEGQKVSIQVTHWAEATDSEGRVYLLYQAKNLSSPVLVIQPFDSFYCFEVIPVEGADK
jgi:hypothetical protein